MKPAQGLLAARLLLISILLLSLPAGPAGAATYTVSNLAGDDTTTNGLGYEMNQANGDGYNVNTTINFSSLFNTPQTITTFFTSPNIYKQPGNNLTLTPTVGLLTINGFAGAPFVFQGGGTLSLGNMIIENNASLAIDGSTLALSNVTENGDMSLTNAVTVNTQGTNDSIGGQLYGGGSLTKTGSGALTLSNDGNLQDDTIVRGGTLSVSSDGQMGYTFGYLAVDGGTFQTTASFSSDRFIILGGGTFDVTSGTTLTLTGQLTNGGGLSLTDTGTLVLTNNTNSYTGGTVVGSGSTLSISNDAQLGNSSGNLTLNGGTLETTAGFSSSRNLLLSGGATLDTASGTTDTWNGLVSGTGGLNVTGPGTLVLADSSNSYTGGTAVTGGTLSISADGDLGDSSGNLTLDGGTLQTTSTLSSSRGFSLLAGGGTLNVATATTTTWNGQVGGAGSL
ncbi:MAG TPA: autotransporter-associated beta strand repeat-containing protein, partial [bacterium]|nr:autotransporter-associated beta strand repeat-containing protein [bacterium]